MTGPVDEMKQTFVFILGVLDYLKDNKLASNGSERALMTDKGVHTFDQLEASGYRPKEENVGVAIKYLIEHGMIHCGEQFACDLAQFVMKWDLLKEYMENKGYPLVED